VPTPGERTNGHPGRAGILLRPMTSPPRLGPTLALAAVWVALYLLWLAVRPEEVVTVDRPSRPAATTTTAGRSGTAAGVAGEHTTRPSGALCRQGRFSESTVRLSRG
jgi:hypothetical protein